MKKEVVVAIIIGFSIGLIIAFGLWTANRSIKQAQPESSVIVSEEQSPSPTPTVSNLQIISPEADFVSHQEKITLSGSSWPEATITLVYEEGEKIVIADSQGNFQSDITLVGGTNTLEITSYNESGQEASAVIYGVYTTAEI